jgi:hypothetical protein
VQSELHGRFPLLRIRSSRSSRRTCAAARARGGSRTTGDGARAHRTTRSTPEPRDGWTAK